MKLSMKRSRLNKKLIWARVFPITLLVCGLGGAASAQEVYFEEVALNDSTNGIVIEAENYFMNVEATDGSGSWIEDNTFAGYNGDFYMQSPIRESGGYGGADDAFPQNEEDPSASVPASPYLSYVVKFNTDTTAKNYYMMVRVSAADGSSDSFHYGLNNNPINEGLVSDPNGAWSGDPWGEAHYDVWGWYIRSRHLGSSGRMQLYVEEPGYDTLRIYMRESNCRIDRIIIYDNEKWHPGFEDDDTGKIGPDETKVVVEPPLAFDVLKDSDNISVFPNPFKESTTVQYNVTEGGLVNIQVLNMSGQVVRQLVNEVQFKGEYKLNWDGSNDFGAKLSQGSYIIRVNANGITQTSRFIINQ
jgi:hypothetical protein